MIRRKKTTIFTDAKDNTTVKELKQMIEGKFQFEMVIFIASTAFVFRDCDYFALNKYCRGRLSNIELYHFWIILDFVVYNNLSLWNRDLNAVSRVSRILSSHVTLSLSVVYINWKEKDNSTLRLVFITAPLS